MQEHAPDVYQRVLDADRESQERFSGHGSALAQVYNHIIMPLANQRDRVTQVRLGDSRLSGSDSGVIPRACGWRRRLLTWRRWRCLPIMGFGSRCWRLTRRLAVRGPGHRDWRDVSQNRIDPSRPYLQKLPSGRSIALFFLRWAGIAGRGVREAADARRDAGQSA